MIGTVLAVLVGSQHVSFATERDLTAVRSGDHPGFGRIVVDVRGAKTFKLDQIGNHVVVRFAGSDRAGPAPSSPRNVLTLTTDGATAAFTVVAGASVHPATIANQIVLDILDPPVAISAHISRGPVG